MSDSAAPGVRTANASSNPPVGGRSRRERSWWQRGGLLLLLSVIAVACVGRWLYYRASHVISHDAIVKGTITQVGSRLDGRVSEILVEENQRVRKGDLIARMEDDHVKSRIARWQSEQNRAEKQLKLERVAIDAERMRLNALVEQAESMVSSAEAEVAAADNERARLERLNKRYATAKLPGVISETELDVNSTLLANSSAMHTGAKARLSGAQSGLKAAQLALDALKAREAGLEVLQQQVEIAAGDVATAQVEIESTLIRAPEDGWVSRRIIEAGGSVRVGDPIIALWVGDRVWVEAWVDEANLADFEVGSPVDVRLTAHGVAVLDGRVEAIGVLSEGALAGPRLAGSRDPIFGDSPKFAVRISIPDTDLRVMPGLSAVVGIGSGQSASKLARTGRNVSGVLAASQSN